jgi:hypothetical protein
MKVVRVGHNDLNWSREVQCPECGTLLEVTRADLYLTQVQCVSELKLRVQCDCCVCKNEIIIDRDNERWKGLPERNEDDL